MNDIKELIGTLMRVVGGAEISEDDVSNLDFEADGELMMALNAAYIQLLEFVHDRDLRLADRNVDAEEQVSKVVSDTSSLTASHVVPREPQSYRAAHRRLDSQAAQM